MDNRETAFDMGLPAFSGSVGAIARLPGKKCFGFAGTVFTARRSMTWYRKECGHRASERDAKTNRLEAVRRVCRQSVLV